MSRTLAWGGRNLNPEYLVLLLLALFWGSSYLFIKVAVVEIPPLTLIAIRVTIAAAMLLAVVVMQGHRLPREPAIWGRLLLQAFLNSIGAWTLLAWGQRYIDSATASVLNSTSPMFVFFLTAMVFRHEPTPPRRFLGAVFGMLGVALIVGTDALRGLGDQVIGQGAVLLSALMFAGAAIHGKRFAHLPAAVTAAGTMLLAAVCLVPASLVVDQAWELTPSREAMLAAGALGLFCTGFAMLLYFRLLRTLGSMGTASQSYLRVGVGVALGMAVLGETVTPAMAAGIALTIAGVVLINMPARRGHAGVAATPDAGRAPGN